MYKPFIAVYENKNIARAAEQLIHTASAVGQRIKELERQLGTTLFVPHARGVTPTKEADELYIRIKPALAVLNNAESSVKEFNESSIGVLRIASSSTISSVQIIDFLCDFMKKYPNVKLAMHGGQSRIELAAMLVKRDLDVIVHRLPFPTVTFGDVVIEELCDHKRAFFACKEFLKKHNLGTNLTTSQLRELPLILPVRTREDMRPLFDALKVDSFTEVMGGCELIYSMIKRGVGIGYTYCNLVKQDDSIEMINVIDADLPVHKLGIIYNRDESSKLVLTFIKMIKEFFSVDNEILERRTI